MRLHKHAYVYGYMMKRRAPERGYEQCEYVMLTDSESPKSPACMKELTHRMQTFLGFTPRIIRYKRDAYTQ